MHCSDQKKSQANKPKKLTIAEALDLQSDLLHPDTNANTRPKRATKRQASLFSCSSSAHGFFSFQFLTFQSKFQDLLYSLLMIFHFFFAPRLEAFGIGERERKYSITKRSLGSLHERL